MLTAVVIAVAIPNTADVPDSNGDHDFAVIIGQLLLMLLLLLLLLLHGIDSVVVVVVV